MQVTTEVFEAIVAAAVDGLPEYFHEKMQNVEILLADWPSGQDLAAVGARGQSTLLGLYSGVPLTQRTHGYSLVTPDTITIFQRPIESRCHTRDELVALVRRVVIHEIAHHFGISDARLRELGAY